MEDDILMHYIQTRKSKFRFREVLETSVLAMGPSWTLQTRMSHFVTIKDISEYTNLLRTIPSLGERRHFDAQNTNKKVQISIS